MNVIADADQRVTKISKSIDPALATAQSMQLAKFDADGAASVSSEVEVLVNNGQENVFPTSAYNKLINNNKLNVVEAGDFPWAEIDSLSDYEMALQNVLPLID